MSLREGFPKNLSFLGIAQITSPLGPQFGQVGNFFRTSKTTERSTDDDNDGKSEIYDHDDDGSFDDDDEKITKQQIP